MQDDGADGRDGKLQSDRDAHAEQAHRLRPAGFPIVLFHVQNRKSLFEICDTQKSRAKLRDNRSDRRARYAHAEHAHRQQIKHNIDGRRGRQKPHRRFAVAQRAQDTRAHIIKDRRRNTDEDDKDVVERIVHLLRRRSHEAQKPARSRKRHGQQQRRHDKPQPNAARHIPAQLVVFTRTE